VNTPDLSIIERAVTPVLYFSGGADSLACFHILQPFWGKLTLLYANAGDEFPETREVIDGVRGLVRNYVEVTGNAPALIRQYGFPSDLLPVRNWSMGKTLQPNDSQLIQTSIECCYNSLWSPTLVKAMELKADVIIRGQRKDELRRTPINDGHVEAGITYVHLIEGWTAQDVRDYLQCKGVELPAHYAYTQKSLDCKHCTAFADESIGKRIYMAKFHPQEYREVSRRLYEIGKGVALEADNFQAAMEAGTDETERQVVDEAFGKTQNFRSLN